MKHGYKRLTTIWILTAFQSNDYPFYILQSIIEQSTQKHFDDNASHYIHELISNTLEFNTANPKQKQMETHVAHMHILVTIILERTNQYPTSKQPIYAVIDTLEELQESKYASNEVYNEIKSLLKTLYQFGGEAQFVSIPSNKEKAPMETHPIIKSVYIDIQLNQVYQAITYLNDKILP